jgi:CubicO group peptidase (beta-lactamase class C family)
MSRRAALRKCLVLAAASIVALESGAQSTLADSMRQRIDQVMATVDHTDAPGCAVGVGQNGDVAYERGYGMSDLQHGLAITPTSIFHVASISKQFAAAAVGILAVENRLSLDDDVRTYVPEVPDHGHRVTIRQLIHHTSGLRDQWSLLSYGGWREDDVINERDVLEMISRQRQLNFVPESEYVYSNTGYTLLGVIVKRVTGMSLRDFAHQRFFAPLGMTRTHFHDDHTMIVPNRTSAYAPRAGGGWSISIPVFDTYGATSLFTTPRDLIMWMAQLDKPSVTSGGLVAQMQTPGLLTDGTSTNYGFGLSMGRYRGLRVVGHAGADAGYRAHAERYPDHGVSIVVLCNASNTNPGIMARRIADVVLGFRMEPPAPAVDTTRAAISPEARTRWAGTYRDSISRLILRVRMSGDTITLGDGRRLTPSSDTTAFAPGGSQQFTLSVVNGAVRGIAIAPRGTRAVFFRREPPFAPARAALPAYAGEYRSDELYTTYRIALTDSGLVLRTRRAPDIRLEPSVPDGFALVPYGSVIEFTRTVGRVVNGFLLTDGRMRGVRFVRISR